MQRGDQKKGDPLQPQNADDAQAAVTRSPLGVAIRREVVKSAQLADALDARWDALSVATRRKSEAASAPTPAPPLDARFADAVRAAADNPEKIARRRDASAHLAEG